VQGQDDQLTRYKNAASINETDALAIPRIHVEQKDQLVAKTQKYVDEHCGAPAPAS